MFALKQQFGTRFDGSEVKLKQFQILFDGALVGYLPYGQVSQIQTLLQFPHDALTDEAVAMLELEAADGQDIESVKVERPEQHSRQFVEAVQKALDEEGRGEDDE